MTRMKSKEGNAAASTARVIAHAGSMSPSYVN